MKRYTMKYFNGGWDDIPKAEISEYPWGGDYRPAASGKLAYDEENVYIRLEAAEPLGNVRRMKEGLCYCVHLDSCLECFLKPFEDDGRYINFEINPNGAYHIAVGDKREGRRNFSDEELEPILIRTEFSAPGVNKENPEAERLTSWSAELTVPIDFIAGIFEGFNLRCGLKMRGNFMKCGDRTPAPHYGMWNPGETPNPDYHQSAYFGEIVPETGDRKPEKTSCRTFR